jgi:hypothetical protein
MKVFWITIGCVAGLLLLGLFGWLFWVGLAMELGKAPDTAVIAGSEMKPATREAIVKLVPLRPGEKIEFFYSAGLWSFAEDGNLITDQRIVSYMTDEGEFTFDEADLEDIVQVVPEFSDSWFEDSLVWVELGEGEGFYLLLSTEEGGDRKAINYLASRGIRIGSASEFPESDDSDSEEMPGEEMSDSVSAAELPEASGGEPAALPAGP